MKQIRSLILTALLLTPLAALLAAGQEATGAGKVPLAANEERVGFPASAAAPAVTDLRCEYQANPFGIDVTKPRLSWLIQSERRGERQTAYQILVASTPELLAPAAEDQLQWFYFYQGKLLQHGKPEDWPAEADLSGEERTR